MEIRYPFAQPTHPASSLPFPRIIIVRPSSTFSSPTARSFSSRSWVKGKQRMERRENRLIEDSSSNFAGLCSRKRRLPRGKASTRSSPIRERVEIRDRGCFLQPPSRGLRLVWPSSTFNERKSLGGGGLT